MVLGLISSSEKYRAAHMTRVLKKQKKKQKHNILWSRIKNEFPWLISSF